MDMPYPAGQAIWHTSDRSVRAAAVGTARKGRCPHRRLLPRQTALIVGKDLQNRLNRAGHLALLVGVLDAQIEYAAALVGETLVRDRTEQVAQMHKAGRLGAMRVTFAPSGSTRAG